MSAAPAIVLAAGGLTFFNEWYQTGTVNWRVPIATFGGAWFVAAIAEVSDQAAVGLSVMVLIVAASTKFGGKSVFQEFASVVGKGLQYGYSQSVRVRGRHHRTGYRCGVARVWYRYCAQGCWSSWSECARYSGNRSADT